MLSGIDIYPATNLTKIILTRVLAGRILYVYSDGYTKNNFVMTKIVSTDHDTINETKNVLQRASRASFSEILHMKGLLNDAFISLIICSPEGISEKNLECHCTCPTHYLLRV